MNHPLDCPVCDKGGECPLQNQALSHGNAESRFRDVKRTYPKPIAISTQVLLDRERCVLCARCTRFSAADRRRPVHRAVRARRAAAGRGLRGRAVLLLLLRQHRADLPGGRADRRELPLPVPAVRPGLDAERLRALRLRAAPSAPTTGAVACCAASPATTPRSTRSGTATRVAGPSSTRPPRDRITTPLVRNPETGEQVEVSWSDALEYAARGCAHAARATAPPCSPAAGTPSRTRTPTRAFAREALGTGDVDFRIRPHSDEEAAFLRAHVQGRPLEVTYADLDRASAVLLVAFEPEEESPIVFLRLRKAARKRGLKVACVAPLTTPSVVKTMGSLIRCRPGDEPAVLDELNLPAGRGRAGRGAARRGARRLLRGRAGWPSAPAPASPGSPGGPASAGRSRSGCCPRRAPATPPRSSPPRPPAELDGLVVGAVDPADLPDPALAAEALPARSRS